MPIRATFGFGEDICGANHVPNEEKHSAARKVFPETRNSRWITRKDVKVDRVACPWLIRRFVDPEAEFIFVSEDELLPAAARLNAIPFDAPRLQAVRLNHRGQSCTFEALLEDYKLIDPALQRLALIVRGADIKGQEHISGESLGLRAIAHGFALTGISDEERLEREFPIYDALYQYVRSRIEASPDLSF
jgi:hypothetical protein